MTTTPSEEPEKQSNEHAWDSTIFRDITVCTRCATVKQKNGNKPCMGKMAKITTRDELNTNKQEDQSDVELPDDLEHALNSMLSIVRYDEFDYDGNADKQARQKERTRQAVKTFKQYLNARQDRAVVEAELKVWKRIRSLDGLYVNKEGCIEIHVDYVDEMIEQLTNNKKPNEEEVK